jgi:hypothetical protein
MLRILQEAANKALQQLLNVHGVFGTELKHLGIAVEVWTSKCSQYQYMIVASILIW